MTSLYVYGTLRPGLGETIELRGSLYDLGPFPGVILDGRHKIICEKIEVDDLQAVDFYEGYREKDPHSSLYIRRPLVVPYGFAGWIYEYNRPVDERFLIEHGDWLLHKQQQRGVNGNRFNVAA